MSMFNELWEGIDDLSANFNREIASIKKNIETINNVKNENCNN